MIKPFHIQTILVSLLLVSCASGPVNAGAQPEDPAFIVITKNPDDQVDIQYESGTALIDIQSPTGIGSAMFELESGTMPGEMIFRLHLKGLEEFRLLSAQVSVSASVSGNDKPAISQRIISSGAETTILTGHSLWMEIELVSNQVEHKIPLEDGYFEVKAPREFIQNVGKTFEIEWVDFYR